MNNSKKLRRLCQKAALQHSEAASLCGKSERQWRRYLADEVTTPQDVITILELMAGNIGIISKKWDNWKLCRISGALIDPFGRSYSHTWHEDLHWHFELLAAQRARLREEIKNLKKGKTEIEKPRLKQRIC